MKKFVLRNLVVLIIIVYIILIIIRTLHLIKDINNYDIIFSVILVSIGCASLMFLINIFFISKNTYNVIMEMDDEKVDRLYVRYPFKKIIARDVVLMICALVPILLLILGLNIVASLIIEMIQFILCIKLLNSMCRNNNKFLKEIANLN